MSLVHLFRLHQPIMLFLESMAPNKAAALSVKHQPSSYGNAKASPTKSDASNTGRRDIDGRVHRAMKEHLGHLNKVKLRTTKVDGLRIDEQIYNEMLALQ